MIHTLTLNPAIDRILYLSRFDKNITNRIQKTVDTIGGKGTHVSINLKILGKENTAFGISHGKSGQKVINMLNEYGIEVRFKHYDDGSRETRTNYLIIEDTGDCTIAAERGVTLKTEELNELLEDMKATIQPGDYLIFSGDASNSPDPSVYNKILEMFRDRDLKFFLDTSVKSLKECIRETPYMIKPNLDELSTLAGHPIAEDDASIVEAIESLDSYNVPIIAVSLGGDGSIVKAPEGYYRVHPPKVNVQNTIGCGDCFLSGFVYGLSEGYSIEDTIRIATAVSAATAESKLSAGYDLERAKELKEQVTIEKIK